MSDNHMQHPACSEFPDVAKYNASALTILLAKKRGVMSQLLAWLAWAGRNVLYLKQMCGQCQFRPCTFKRIAFVVVAVVVVVLAVVVVYAIPPFVFLLLLLLVVVVVAVMAVMVALAIIAVVVVIVEALAADRRTKDQPFRRPSAYGTERLQGQVDRPKAKP